MVEGAVDQFPHPISFPFKLGWARDYGSLLRSEYAGVTDAAELPQIALDNKRTIVSAKGGSGKSTIAKRVADASKDQGVLVALLDMKRWSPKIEEMWNELGNDVMSQADFLLRELATVDLSLAAIDSTNPSTSKLIIVDGLNEVRARVGQQIVAVADHLVTSFIKLSVIVMDRLVRRDVNENRWALATVLPLDSAVVRRAIEDGLGAASWAAATEQQRQMLENPFFLNKTLQDQNITASTSEAVNAYILQFSNLKEDEVKIAGHAAYHMYKQGRGGRTFSFDLFSSIAGKRIVGELVQSGILRPDGENAYFQHHLFHDVLAGLYLAQNPNEWTNESFDAVSFNASSFDVIARVLEQTAPKDADTFARHVFDWNPYAVAYAISELKISDQKNVSEEMLLVVAAMLAERIWDRIEATAQRSMDALGVMGTTLAHEFLRARSLQDVISRVAAFPGHSDWFMRWQSLYARQPGAPALDSDLDSLASADPIEGWTAANVLRRSHLHESHLQGVIKLACNPDASEAKRWRAVHVLGAISTNVSVETLFNRFLKDVAEWVQYGALRSLMELAARSEGLRSEILAGLLERVEVLRSKPALLDEFARAAFARVEGDSQGWIDGVAKILDVLRERAKEPEEVQRWHRMGQRLEARHAA